MVCRNGNASSQFSVSSIQQERELPQQQQQRQQQQQAALFGLEHLMTATYPPPSFEPSRTVLLRRKVDVINCITKRIRRISEGLTVGSFSFKNRRALAHTVVRSALQAAYHNCRRDIFVASSFDAAEGVPVYSDTIAGAFLCNTVNSADPVLYASVLSSFVAYGVDFAAPRHSAGEHAAASNQATPPLPLLDTALYCLHETAKTICARPAAPLEENITEHNENGDPAPKQDQGSFQNGFLTLVNSYTLCSLLRFFAEEEEEGGEVVVEAKWNEAKPSAGGRKRDAADSSLREAPLRYTTAVLYQLFSMKLGPRALEGALPSLSASSSVPMSSISSFFALLFKRVIDYCSFAGVRWNLYYEVGVEAAQKALAYAPPLLRETAALLVSYCRQFPPLYQSVLKQVGAEAHFILDQLVHSKLFHFPSSSHEEMEMERYVFYDKKSRTTTTNDDGGDGNAPRGGSQA
ncbi:ubiquitin hydrolase [Trypanosoma rangeli]|uniref:Ubiquitin hydrolase n=1 Tax=Trypanosoma rangeli TaxID=5698 RepID=A0A422NUE4_TRYRA|nr:ubiquitin hydrolase [Trypanosoma rangeli]RNF09081.1 ubiquitin hydrolase [Trypanosoma rangeli]|eukprot:RNF09081.1 ubiquitin hydrolase [Trypanosoma rangeli]